MLCRISGTWRSDGHGTVRHDHIIKSLPDKYVGMMCCMVWFSQVCPYSLLHLNKFLWQNTALWAYLSFLRGQILLNLVCSMDCPLSMIWGLAFNVYININTLLENSLKLQCTFMYVCVIAGNKFLMAHEYSMHYTPYIKSQISYQVLLLYFWNDCCMDSLNYYILRASCIS